MGSWEYGHEPPKNDDGSYKSVNGRFGFVIAKPDGTIEDLDGNQIAPSSDGSGFDEIGFIVDHPERPPIAALGDTESVELPIRVPDGQTLEVYRWDAFDAADGSAPTGLTAELLDGADTVQASENTANTQSKSTPISSHSNTSGSVSIFKLRAYNGTGATIDTPGVGCAFGFRVV